MKNPIICALLVALLAILAGCARSATPPASGIATGSPASTTRPGTPAGLSDSDLFPLAQEFINQLANGEYEAATARFDDAMLKAAPAPQLKQIWEQLLGQVGAYQEQLDTQSEEVGEYTRLNVTTQFEKAKIVIQVVFNSQGQISGLFFEPATDSQAAPAAYAAPDYVDNQKFTETDVTVGSGEWALPGTLSLPVGDGPFPAVVLVHGSGPNDRDETVGANKPFKDLAWGLASQGIAVLRYDKRTNAHANLFTPDLISKLTVQEETIDDALLAAQLLRQTDKIDPQRVYVLGHSLGAMLAPRIGQQDPQLSGLVMMAAPNRPIQDLALEQYNYIFNLDGKLDSQETSQLQALQTQVANAKNLDQSDSIPAEDLPLGMPAAYMRALNGYVPSEIAKSLAMPLLLLQGGRDYQVSPTRDFESLKKALAGKANAEFKLYPELNHLFIPGEGPSSPSEYQTAGHVSPQVIADIAAWLNARR
jgi:dienelactone hydrolase